MRVLVLTNKIPYPPKDGGAIATLNMAVGLAQAGAIVTVLAMSTPKHKFRAQDIPKSILDKVRIKDIFVDTRISLVRAINNLFFSNLPYNAERFISEEFKMELTKILSEKFDVVQLEGPYLLPYIDTLRMYHKGLVSFRAHNVEWEIWNRISILQSNPIKRLYFKLISNRLKAFESRLLRLTDILVPISSRDESMLREMGFAGKSLVIQTGFVESSSNLSNPDMEYPSLFHLGGLDWLPNCQGIIWFLKNCWQLIQNDLPNARFYIAGRNAPKSFSKLVSKFKNVVFCGEVDDSNSFMRSKAVMVVPLLSGSGMRIKIVEGLARKRAIVSTSIGVEGLDLTDGIEAEIADEPALFAQKVIGLLTDRSKFNQMANAGKQYVEKNLNNFSNTAKLFRFYHEILDSTNAFQKRKGFICSPQLTSEN